MSVSMSMSVSVSVSVSVFLYLSVYVSMSIKYSATNIFVQDPDYSVNFQGPYKVAQKLKGLSLERGWTKSAEILGASHLKRDLSVDTTFSQTNIANQSL
jgi:hypothetical protein